MRECAWYSRKQRKKETGEKVLRQNILILNIHDAYIYGKGSILNIKSS